MKSDLGSDFDISGRVRGDLAIYCGNPVGCDLFYLEQKNDAHPMMVGGSAKVVAVHNVTEEILARLTILEE